MLKLSERGLVWVAAALTFAALAMLTGFFTLGGEIPLTTDMNPGLYSTLPYQFPPQAVFSTNNWLGQLQMPQDLQPMSLLAHLPMWMFFSGYYPLMAALSLLACYWFLREIGFRRGVAVLGGLLYAWQGDLFSNLLAGHFSSATVWWLFALAALFAVRSARRRSWLDSAWCGVCTGMMVSILPDRGALCSLLIGGIYLLEIGRKRLEGSEALRHVGRLILVVAVAVGVALPGVVSTVSWAAVKAAPTGVENAAQKYQWATQWSYTPEEMFSYVVPGFFGWRNGSASGPYWGRIGQSATEGDNPGGRNFCLATFTVGTLGCLLAAAGVAALVFGGRGQKHKLCLGVEWRAYGWFALAACLLGWLLALGKYGPLYSWFYQLPYMDTWRNPLKFMTPVSLGFVLLASCGAQYLSRLIESEEEQAAAKARVKTWLWIVLVVMAVVWVLSFPARLPMTIRLGQLQYMPGEIEAILSTMRASLFIAGLLVGGILYVWHVLSLPKAKRQVTFINPLIQQVWNAMVSPQNLGRSLLALLGVGVMAQMLWVQSHYSELYDFRAYYSQSPLFKKLKSGGELCRTSVEVEDPVMRQMLTTLFPYQGIQCLDIPAASRIPEDYQKLFRTLQSNRVRLQQLAGVKYWVCSMSSLSAIQNDPNFRPLINGINYYTIDPYVTNGSPTHAVVQLKDYLPKVSLVTKGELYPDEETLLERLADPKWSPHKSVLVRQEDIGVAMPKVTGKPDETVRALTPSAKVVHYDGQRIEVDVQTPEPATLLICDRFDAAWRAQVNGKPTTIFPADFILRGLSVPAGVSRVVMTYEVPMTPYYVQLAVLALVAAWGIGAAWYQRRDRAT